MDVEHENTIFGEGDRRVSLIPDEIDYHSQLNAARVLLSWQDKWSATTSENLDDHERRTLKVSGSALDWMVDEHIEMLTQSFYENAARSMAAVGMLAPLIESLFKRMASDLKWEWPRSRDTAAHILRFVDEKGLTLMPSDLKSTLGALFEYRNKMFHFGLEWPVLKREQFARRIVEAKWPTSWFDVVYYGEEIWMACLSSEFISSCLAVIDGVLLARATAPLSGK